VTRNKQLWTNVAIKKSDKEMPVAGHGFVLCDKQRALYIRHGDVGHKDVELKCLVDGQLPKIKKYR
jgi:hypothetical protein